MIRVFVLLFCLLYSTVGYSSVLENVVSIKTDYGVKAYLVEDRGSDIVDFLFTFSDAGTSYDTSENAGIVPVIASLFNDRKFVDNSFDISLDFQKKGIKMSMSFDKDNIYIRVRSLADHVDFAINSMISILSGKMLNEEDVQFAISKLKMSYNRANSDPIYLASILRDKFIYADHQYSKSEFPDDVKFREDYIDMIFQYMADKINRLSMHISVVGDINIRKVNAILDKQYFIELPLISTNRIMVPKVDIAVDSYEYNMHMDIPQSVLMFVHEGVKFASKDYYALKLLSAMFTGDIEHSLLMSELRNKRGYIYSMPTNQINMQNSNLWIATTEARPNNIDDIKMVIREIFARVKHGEISEDFFNETKRRVLLSEKISFSENGNILSVLARVQNLRNNCMSCISGHIDNLSEVTFEYVLDFAKRFLKPEKLIFIVVGDNKKD